jgi:uncharacterized protein YaiE (UPF0345 family)
MMETLLLDRRSTPAEMTCVCCNCKREKADADEWREHTPRPGERLTHGICPVCLYELYPDVAPLVRGR